MRPIWLHRASQSASEGPVVYIRSRGEFHEAAKLHQGKAKSAQKRQSGTKARLNRRAGIEKTLAQQQTSPTSKVQATKERQTAPTSKVQAKHKSQIDAEASFWAHRRTKQAPPASSRLRKSGKPLHRIENLKRTDLRIYPRMFDIEQLIIKKQSS